MGYQHFPIDAPKHIESNIAMYSLHFKIKVTIGYKLRYEIKVMFGEISLKLRQTNWNVAINNVNVVASELSRHITIYTCLTFDNWTRRCWRTSMWFYVLQCHPPKMAGFQWNWCQNVSTLLWTPLARRRALSESYAPHTVSYISVLKVQKMTLSHGFSKT
jgi:hypothetical protein